jgi:hypothetical protein
MFFMNCIVAHGALTLTAYVYCKSLVTFVLRAEYLTNDAKVPFGGFVIPKIVSHIRTYGGRNSEAFLSSLAQKSFAIHPEKLRNTVLKLCVLSTFTRLIADLIAT